MTTLCVWLKSGNSHIIYFHILCYCFSAQCGNNMGNCSVASVGRMVVDWLDDHCMCDQSSRISHIISTFCATTVVQNLEIMWEIDGCAWWGGSKRWGGWECEQLLTFLYVSSERCARLYWQNVWTAGAVMNKLFPHMSWGRGEKMSSSLLTHSWLLSQQHIAS